MNKGSFSVLLIASLLLLIIHGCGKDTRFNNKVEPPEIIGTITAPDTLYTNSYFVASLKVTDPQNLSVQARFNWGNGDVSDFTPLSPSGTLLEMPYAYRNTGVYQISVTARNSEGLTVSGVLTHPVSVLQREENTLVNDLIIHNNRFFMNTTLPVNLKFSYEATDNQGKVYHGYSATKKQTDFSFPLPVDESGFVYEMALNIENASTLKDTLLIFSSTESRYPMLRVDFVDVRQGDGVLIQTPEGHNIAVDGGYGSRVPGFSQPAYWNGAGYPFMLNYTLEEGVSHFSYLVETHRHMDHWGGLADIMDFGISYDYYLSPDSTQGYQVGDFLNINSAVSFEILNIDFPPNVSPTNENNRSVVLRVEYGEIAYILTGDIEHQVENYLVSNNFHLSADVLKVAHHGSQTSSRDYFLNSVFDRYARVAVISFGTGNPYNHPHNINRFADFDVFGTNQPSESYHGDNFHFNTGDVQTYTDGYILIISY